MAEQADKVTLRDVYEAINSLEAKIDKRYDTLEDRVDTLENWRWYIMGSIAVVIGIIWYFANEIKSHVIR